jgi:hypothetical protein
VFVVRGTKKFLDRVNGHRLEPGQTSTTALGDWYANVLFWKPQVVLFVSEATLVPVLVPLAPAATVIDRFVNQLSVVLSVLDIDPGFATAELTGMHEHQIATTANRIVVGVMNEFRYLAEVDRGASPSVDLLRISLWLAGTPLGPLQRRLGFPDRELAALVADWKESPSRSTPLTTVESVPHAGRTAMRTVHQLKATIIETKPPVWRRVLVPSDYTLGQVHDVLQAAFGWSDYHLHEFEFGRTRYGVVDDEWDSPKDESTVTLARTAQDGRGVPLHVRFWRQLATPRRRRGHRRPDIA